jgi:hypothetical protein
MGIAAVQQQTTMSLQKTPQQHRSGASSTAAAAAVPAGRQIYESMLFLFVEHAFDVGDLLEVETMQYRVKKIDLMYTLMVKSTGEHCYYPNTRLITLPVLNLTRASARSDKVVFSLDVGRGGAAARAALMVSMVAAPVGWGGGGL